MLENRNRLAYAMLILFMVVFIAVVFRGLFAHQPGDENVYYYMGKMITEGKVPYRDFFFAHPPLQIYLVSLLYKIFGFNIAILKSIPLISTLISAFFVFKISEERFGNFSAILSALLFLFSYSVMFNSVFSFGVDLAAMFLIIGTYLLWNRKNYIFSGLFFGLAAITRLLSLVPVLAIFSMVLLSGKKGILRLSSGFFIIFLIANGAFLLLPGNDYPAQVYKFHLLKGSAAKENFNEYVDIIKLNWILFSSASLLFFVKEKKRIAAFAVISIVYLVFLTILKTLFGFYFIIAFPFLAVVGGCSIALIFRDIKLQRKWKLAISAVLLSIFAWNLASDVLFLEKIGFRGFERGSDLIEYVNSISSKDTLLFGDASVAPLLALLTNKEIALDFADTNNQVFISGARNLNSVLAGLKGHDVVFIARSREGISYFSEVRGFLNRNCEFLSQFNDKIEGAYAVYRCR